MVYIVLQKIISSGVTDIFIQYRKMLYLIREYLHINEDILTSQGNLFHFGLAKQKLSDS